MRGATSRHGGIEVRFVDADGRDVAVGQAGELLVRGPNVMQGYFNDPDATAAAIDADGWLRTGDISAGKVQKFLLRK
ncbi:AMP-binding protein [Sphingopyxis sp.]|uniref:AMP-binding protein n=1 Tax=Sphingopyxis sp. TaxID=1908224 RepID=UPI0035B365C0